MLDMKREMDLLGLPYEITSIGQLQHLLSGAVRESGQVVLIAHTEQSAPGGAITVHRTFYGYWPSEDSATKALALIKRRSVVSVQTVLTVEMVKS